jgi:1-acyl-sn-glycerol-3-phosphate acyltransferase
VTTAFKPDPRRTLGYRAFRTFVHTLWGAYFRPQVTGTEHVPTTGAYIIAPIHRSNADFAFAIYVTERKTFFMAKDELWKSTLLGDFVGAMGAFPVTRGVADRTALSAAEAVLRAGEPLVLFPEGTRQDGPAVGELLEGASFLAARTGAPIIPVGIAGTDRAPEAREGPRRHRRARGRPHRPRRCSCAAEPDHGDHRRAARCPAGRLRPGVRPAQRSRIHVRTTTLR